MSAVTLTAVEFAEVVNQAINAGIIIAAETLELSQAEIDRLFRKVTAARNLKRAKIVKQKTKKNVPTGLRLDRSMGLLGTYRVFTANHRYGTAGWDWAAGSALQEDGSVTVLWPATKERPFELKACYRLPAADVLAVEFQVKAVQMLSGFEVFLASYFDTPFTNSMVLAKTADASAPRWISATTDRGDWQTFPRDNSAAALFQDGRWKIEPNPVDWRLLEKFAEPKAMRRAGANGLAPHRRLRPDCPILDIRRPPGGPLAGMRSIGDRRNRPSEADMARLESYLGIDKPLFLRYLTWLIGDDWLGSDWVYVGLGQYRYPKLGATGEQLIIRDAGTNEMIPQWNKARFWADPGPAILNPGYNIWVWGEHTGSHQFTADQIQVKPPSGVARPEDLIAFGKVLKVVGQTITIEDAGGILEKIRRLMLYPTELRAQSNISTTWKSDSPRPCRLVLLGC